MVVGVADVDGKLADVVRGRTLTSWPSLAMDIRNAGGTWVDEQVLVDRGLVTSRRPDDLEAFDDKMVEEFASSPPSHAHRWPGGSLSAVSARSRRYWC
jgi:putative intracellular protease/amidase